MSDTNGQPKFYRTTMTIVLLSKDGPADFDLDAAVGDARVVYDVVSDGNEEIDGPAMAKALEDARSYPGFFDLEDEDEGWEDAEAERDE